MSRTPLVAGNWKLHNDRAQSVALARAVASGLPSPCPVDVVVAPVFTALDAVNGALAGTRVGLAAQNCSVAAKGAFTGEVSAPLLADVGAKYVIVGHSERRQLFGETDTIVRDKIAAVLAEGLVPIACVGETWAEREAGRTSEVVLGQLDAAIEGLDAVRIAPLVIAYEPVWAIGTGKVASPADAQEVHAAIRARLGERVGPSVAADVRILYGGSVKADNATEILAQPDIDGALVGGASLTADSFLAIVRAALPR